MKIILSSLFLIGFFQISLAQDSLSLFEVFESLRQNHPLFKAALLESEKGDAELTIARGGFDPKLELNFNDKDFNETDYYEYQNAAIKIPTWLGLDIKAGIENNSGKYLNPEYGTPDEGLAFIEFSLPILRNLITDERRTSLRNAQQFAEYSKAERDYLISQLHQRVAYAYWDWYGAFKMIKLYQNSLNIATNRFLMVKNSFRLGAYAAIDTVEANMEVQRQKVLLYDAVIQFNKARFILSSHLWDEQGTAIDLDENSVPVATNPYDEYTLAFFLQQSDSLNPKIRKAEWKLQMLQAQQRLYTNMLLPELNLTYKPLSMANELNYNQNNRTIGLSVSAPIFVRKERGKLALSKAKTEQQELNLSFTSVEVNKQIEAAHANYYQYKQMHLAQQANALDALKLRDAEQRKLSLGSANVFMVNYRDKYLLESQAKEIIVEVKKQIALADLYAKTGIWPQIK